MRRRDLLYVDVGSHLRAARRRRGLYQSDIAEAIGVTAANISLYETGAIQVRLKTFLQMCAVIGVDPLDIITSVMNDAPRLIGTVNTLEPRERIPM